jgi:chemotaxis protein CheD
MNALRKHTLFPGQLVISYVPTLISTVLGSCVAVCLWDKSIHVGGMNHYLLPGSKEEVSNPDRGWSATRMLIRSILNRQASIDNLEAKVFGGCNSLYQNNDLYKIGERNIAIAMEVLKEFDIKVSAQHVGGTQGRKIVFNTSTGKVRMRLLGKTANEINEEINKGFSV